MTNRPEIRPATVGDLESFYGCAIDDGVRAYVAVLDGRIVGAGGVFRHEGTDVAFCDLSPELKQHPRVIVEGMKLFRREFGACTALANPKEPGAPYFLARLGFTPYQTETGQAFARPA